MTAFVESTECQEGKPPFFFPGVRIWSFLLEADPDKLEDWCDRFLNISPRFRFRPVTNHVFLGFNDYPQMFSEAPGMEGMGFITQHEYYLMLPVVRKDLDPSNFFLPHELSWVFPFIGVDNASSASTGREVLGFQKTVGRIDLVSRDDTPSAPHAFEGKVAMPGFRHIGKDARQEILPLVHATADDPLEPEATTAHAGPWAMLHHAGLLGELEEGLFHLFSSLEPGIDSVTNLKQFRDPEHPEMAAFQALVRCHWALSNIGPPTIFESASVSITDNLAFRPAADLGLIPAGAPGKDGTPFKPILASGFTTDMRFDQVRNLWVAP